MGGGEVSTLEQNFDVNIGRAACEGRRTKWNLGTISTFDPGPRKIVENLNREARI
jgi:hypothetical protein